MSKKKSEQITQREINYKKKYERILTGGTAKDKAMLIGNHLADSKAGKTVFLTEDQINTLVNTIDSEKDVAIYDKYSRIFSKIDEFLLHATRFKLTYLDTLHQLDKLLLLQDDHQELEHITNIIIHSTTDVKIKKKIVADIKISDHYLKTHKILSFIKEYHGMEDKITIASTINHDIQKILPNMKEQQKQLKTLVQAIKDFIQDNKFNVPAFSGSIKEIESWAKKDKTELLLLKTSKSSNKNSNITEPDYDQTELDTSFYKHYRGFLDG